MASHLSLAARSAGLTSRLALLVRIDFALDEVPQESNGLHPNRRQR
jgi:hypothetical protein